MTFLFLLSWCFLFVFHTWVCSLIVTPASLHSLPPSVCVQCHILILVCMLRLLSCFSFYFLCLKITLCYRQSFMFWLLSFSGWELTSKNFLQNYLYFWSPSVWNSGWSSSPTCKFRQDAKPRTVDCHIIYKIEVLYECLENTFWQGSRQCQ